MYTLNIKPIVFVAFIALTKYSCRINPTSDADTHNDSIQRAHYLEVLEYQEEMNSEFADSNHSPLDIEDLVKFTELDFYEPDIDYKIEADFIRTPDEEPFEMPTTTERTPVYVKFGELHFTLKDTALQLNVYQNIELVKKQAYKDYLFLPFTDLTNGFGTYGGGRYIDLRYSGGEKITLDFNKAYNPYCAYSSRWSCPIPPAENHLNVEIKAGVKSYH
jgi:uncharacterized protein (DUF1684 family)